MRTYLSSVCTNFAAFADGAAPDIIAGEYLDVGATLTCAKTMKLVNKDATRLSTDHKRTFFFANNGHATALVRVHRHLDSDAMRAAISDEMGKAILTMRVVAETEAQTDDEDEEGGGEGTDDEDGIRMTITKLKARSVPVSAALDKVMVDVAVAWKVWRTAHHTSHRQQAKLFPHSELRI